MRYARVPAAYDSTPGKMLHKYELSAVELEPQQLVLHTGSQLIHVELVRRNLVDWCWWLYYEVRVPFTPVAERVFQTAHISQGIPWCCKYLATGVRWNTDVRGERTTPKTTYHLYEYPAGTRMLDSETDRIAKSVGLADPVKGD